MASTDARPVPRKNVAYRVTFPILDADGDLVTGAASLDSEISKDGGTFADCTNEATEIATSSGVYFLDLTSTEMNADTVAIIVKTSTSGAKTTTLVMYPEESGDYRADVVQWNGTAVATPTVAGVPEVDVTHFNGVAGTFASGRPEVNTSHIAGSAVSTTTAQIGVNVVQISADATAADNAESFFDGTGYAGTGNTIPTVTTVGTVNALAAGSITASVIATGAVDADALAADAGTEIANAVWALDATGQQTQGTFGQAIGDPGATAKSIWQVANNLPNTGSLTNLDAAVSTRATQTSVDTIDDFLDTEIAAIQTAVVTNIPASIDALPTAAENADAVWDEAIAGHLTGGSTGAALNGASAPSAAAVADAVWDEALAGHLGAGSTGAALNGAGSAGDPWGTTLPGAYGAGTAGFIVGTYLDMAISTILTAAGSAPTARPADNAGIRAKIDFLYAMLKHPVVTDHVAATVTVKTSDGSGTIATYSAVDNGTTFQKGGM